MSPASISRESFNHQDVLICYKFTELLAGIPDEDTIDLRWGLDIPDAGKTALYPFQLSLEHILTGLALHRFWKAHGSS